MSSRWKKIWADFWGNKSRTVLTIITIAVGVLAVGFNSSLGLYMAESMDGDYLSASPAEATVYAGPLDDDMVKIAREVPGVEAVEIVLTRLRGDVSGLVGEPATGRVDVLAFGFEHGGDGMLGQPVDLDVGTEPLELMGDGHVAPSMAEPDRRREVERPFRSA